MKVIERAELHLDGRGGTHSVWADQCGNGHNATRAGGAAWAYDRWTLDGVGSSKLTVPHSTALNFGAGQDFTVMVDLMMNGPSPGSGSTLVAKSGLTLYLYNSPYTTLRLIDGGGTKYYNGWSGPYGSRFNLTAVRDTVAGEILLYGDGDLKSAQPDTNATGDLSGSGGLVIGQSSVGTIDGAIYDVAIWREALPAADISLAIAELAAPPPWVVRVNTMPMTPKPSDLVGPLDRRQTEFDPLDDVIRNDAIAGRGIVSGCEVTAQATPDMSVVIAVGTTTRNLTTSTPPAATLTVPAADATDPRFDLVFEVGGVFGLVSGIPASPAPIFPFPPEDSIVLEAIWVPAGVTAITDRHITKKGIQLPA